MRRIEMIGMPLDHARSPSILNPMFRARGEDVEVITREVRPADLRAYVARTRAERSVIGLIVTTPLKHPINAHLDVRTALVGLLGASNCVRCGEVGWIGANFDGYGFLAALTELSCSLAGKRVLLVGCGGAGSAIAASLVDAADIRLAIFDTDRTKAAAFAKLLVSFSRSSTVAMIDAPEGLYDIVVNASPVGMDRGDPSPIPEATVAAAAVVADIVTVEDTALKRMAERLGKTILAGQAMVAGQADLLRKFILGHARSEGDLLVEEL